MARTLVGILQILLKQDVTQKAPAINQALGGIERAATRLGNAKWGAGFQRQLDRLKITPAEAAAVTASYDRLARDINGRIAKADMAAWRTGTLGHFTAVRAGMDEATKSAKGFHTAMGKLVRMGVVTIGGVGGLYLGGRAVRGGATAASEEWRQKAEAKYSGLPQEERDQIWNRSVELSEKRRLNNATVFQVLREAALAMETTGDALAVSDQMTKALLYLSNTLGEDGAVNGLREFNKGMDNIQHISPDEYLKALEAYVRAQQMTGADMDPRAFALAIKYARTAGKIFSDEYLFQWLPFKIAEVGGPDAGTQLRAFSDNTIGGTATDEVKGYQKSIGVRKRNGKMAYADELLQNPERWINERLVPALEAAGVDTSDNVELSQVLNKIASNRLARDFILSAIANWDQKQRLVENLPRTAGLSAADDIQEINPFASLDGLTSSLQNLSGAIGGHVLPVIVPGMNSLGDTINSISTKIREMPEAAFGLGAVGLGLGGLGAWKIGAGIAGLVTAGPSLQTAAVMLQGAATSLGGAGVTGGLGTGAAAAGGTVLGALLRNVLKLGLKVGGPLAVLTTLLDSTEVGAGEDAALNADPAQRAFIDQHDIHREVWATGPTRRQARQFPPDNGNYAGAAGNPMMTEIFPEGQAAPWGGGVAQAKQAGAEMKTALSPEGKPTADLSAVENAISRVQVLLNMLAGVGAASSQAGSRLKSQIESSYSDYGVTP